jgi:two-component system, LuxR family, sensor kinase FixL
VHPRLTRLPPCVEAQWFVDPGEATMNFVHRLLSPDFMPHGYCYQWEPWILWLHVVSDLVITVAYYGIPVILVYIVRRRRDMPFNRVFWMFSLFITACGTTHFFEVWNVWHASYFVAGVSKAVTALASIATTAMLASAIPRAISLPHPDKLQTLSFQHSQALTDLAERQSTIDKLRIAEQALRVSQERLSGIIDSAMDAIISVDEKQRIVVFNAAAEKMFACSSSEALGASLNRFIPERFRAGHAEHHRHFAHSGVTSRTARQLGVLTAQRADGVEFPVEIAISQTNAGSERLFTAIVRDIAERQQAEEALARKVEELEQFAYIASHDLQEPLRMVASYTQLLAERYRGKLDNNADKYIRYAVEGALRMQALIQDLLAFSRAGRNGSQLKNTDCNMVFELAVQNLHTAILESNATVTHDPLPLIAADPTHLQQVFQNLISNAIKFRGTQSPVISVTAARKDNGWEFCVKDNGIGIAAEHRDLIFSIFQRLHTRAEYPGNGIGLAICKKIIKEHGGRIWVESQPAQGSTFKFTLPIRNVEDKPQHEHEASRNPAGGRQSGGFRSDQRSTEREFTYTAR